MRATSRDDLHPGHFTLYILQNSLVNPSALLFNELTPTKNGNNPDLLRHTSDADAQRPKLRETVHQKLLRSQALFFLL